MARIALFSVTPVQFGGGYETFLSELRSHGEAMGHDVEIVSPPRGEFMSAVRLLGLSKRFSHLHQRDLGRGDYRARVASADAVYVKNELLDLAWLKTFYGPGNVTVGFHTRLRTGSALRDFLYSSAFYRKLLAGKKLHFVHAADASEFRPGAPAIVIPNGVSFAERVAERRTKVALYVGRLSREKGPDRLRKILSVMPDGWRLVIAGSGPEEGHLVDVLSDVRVDWLGHIAREELRLQYAKAEVLVIPSRWEIVPFALIEAVSFGVLPLCQDIPPLRALIGSHRELLVDFENKDDIKRAFATIEGMTDSDRHRWQNEIRAEFSQEYAAESLYPRLIDFMLS